MLSLTQPPYDDATIGAVYAQGGCAAVAAHFHAHPLPIGECLDHEDEILIIEGYRVLCDGLDIATGGTIPGTALRHRDYQPMAPVFIELWCRPAEDGECV